MNGRTDGGIGWPARARQHGPAVIPGHRVAVIDDDGNECPVGVPGDVAVNRYDVHGDPDPIFFLGYWKNETRHPQQVHRRLVPHRRPGHARRGRLSLVPGPRRRRVQGGGLPHRPERDRELPGQASGRDQRRRGAQARPRARCAGQGLRGAGARFRGGACAGGPADFDAQLVAQLQAHVKGKLAPYEYPKEIEFIDALPMTTTGKVQRRVLRLQEEEKAKSLSLRA